MSGLMYRPEDLDRGYAQKTIHVTNGESITTAASLML